MVTQKECEKVAQIKDDIQSDDRNWRGRPQKRLRDYLRDGCDRCDLFNVGRAMQWYFSDDLGVNPKADPETLGLEILILRQVATQSLFQSTPRRFIGLELGEHCTQDGFNMHLAPLAYMVSSPKLYQLGYHGPWLIKGSFEKVWSERDREWR